MVIFGSMVTLIKNRHHVKSLLIRAMALCLFFVLTGGGYGARKAEAPIAPPAVVNASSKTHIKESHPLASRENIPDRWHQPSDKRHRHRPFLMLSAGWQGVIVANSVIQRQYRPWSRTFAGNKPVPSAPRGPPCA